MPHYRALGNWGCNAFCTTACIVSQQESDAINYGRAQQVCLSLVQVSTFWEKGI